MSRFLIVISGIVAGIVMIAGVALPSSASAAAPVPASATAASAAKTTAPAGVMVATSTTCHTRSYNYNQWRWSSFSKWHVLNKCHTLKLYRQTRNADGISMWASMFCATIALWSGFLGIFTGPLCIHDFTLSADNTKHDLHYAATHARKCIGLAPWYDTYPWNRADVFPCKYR